MFVTAVRRAKVRDSSKGCVEGGKDGKQLCGRGGESRDSEKSISAEYLIKFKPSDLSLLPGSKATTGTGERRGRTAGRRERRVKEGEIR